MSRIDLRDYNIHDASALRALATRRSEAITPSEPKESEPEIANPDYFEATKTDDVSRLISLKWLIFGGLLIIIGSIVYVSDFESPNWFEPIPYDGEPSFNPIGDLIDSIDDSGQVGEVIDNKVTLIYRTDSPYVDSDIIQHATTFPKNSWKQLGYESDTMIKLEQIRDRIDVMSCREMVDNFYQNPGWDLRSYLAHSILERC